MRMLNTTHDSFMWQLGQQIQIFGHARDREVRRDGRFKERWGLVGVGRGVGDEVLKRLWTLRVGGFDEFTHQLEVIFGAIRTEPADASVSHEKREI